MYKYLIWTEEENGVLVNRTEKTTPHTREVTELWKVKEWDGTQIVYHDGRYCNKI